MSVLFKFISSILEKSEQKDDLSSDFDFLKDKTISGSLSSDIKEINNIFNHFSDLIFREFKIGGLYRAAIFYLSGFVNNELIDSDLLNPLLRCNINKQNDKTIYTTEIGNYIKQFISVGNISAENKYCEVVKNILSGKAVLLVDGINESFIIDVKKTEKRAITEPKLEPLIRGPRDGFTEELQTNITLIRKRIKTSRLKMEKLEVGSVSHTDVVISYIDGIVDESLVSEVKKRISEINIDGVLESGYIEEMIVDNRLSIFPQLGYTERPDQLCSTLLEGHVGIIVDNTPIVLIAPFTFFQAMQSSEDYYQQFFSAFMLRIIRYVFLSFALFLPSFYIAVLTFHQGMLPKNLLITIWESREGVPFPIFVETLLMEIFFEGLREAGVRLPSVAGQTVSIVGALIIGQAAVNAGIVSASTVIIVSVTGIASFVIPHYNLALSFRVLRFVMMILSGIFGVYGIFLGTLFTLIHMSNLKSFGRPYFSSVAPLSVNSLKDVIIRAPWWAMNKRPKFISDKNLRRMKTSRKE